MRRLVLALLLLNVALLGWQRFAAQGDEGPREPDRLSQQIHPERVQVLPPAQAASAAAGGVLPLTGAASDATTLAAAASAAAEPAPPAPAASAPARVATGAVASAVCLEVGPFSLEELPAAEGALATLPQGSWRRQTLQAPPAYLVYLGRFADQKTAQRRLQELRQRGVQAELAHDLPALEPGLVLSRHTQEAQAEAALAALQASRTAPRQARVVASSEAVAVMLRVERPSDAVRAQIADLEPTAALRGGFRGCRKAKV